MANATGPRPTMKRCYGKDFVEAVEGLGGSEQVTRRLWRRTMSVAKGSRYTESNAFNEYLTWSRLSEVVAGGAGQFQHLKQGDWELITGAVQEVVSA